MVNFKCFTPSTAASVIFLQSSRSKYMILVQFLPNFTIRSSYTSSECFTWKIFKFSSFGMFKSSPAFVKLYRPPDRISSERFQEHCAINNNDLSVIVDVERFSLSICLFNNRSRSRSSWNPLWTVVTCLMIIHFMVVGRNSR